MSNQSSRPAAPTEAREPATAAGDTDSNAATEIDSSGPAAQEQAGAESRSGPTARRSKSGKQDRSQAKVTRLGDFQLVKKLGQGGMGTVYLAKQVSLDRKVAVKTLSPELSKRPDLVQRFIREARAMARLDHPNIVSVYAADSYKGLHYAAIEFIDGRSMQDWMKDLKRLSIGDALHVVLVTAEALAHAHEQQMIHRDIKPDNILLTGKGVVKVADFGLAKVLDEDVSMTQSGTGMGTPLYMPPEQARNAKHVDLRTDIYALGTMLYYFLTGDLPFRGDSTLEIIQAKEQGRFTSARRHNPEIPERLDLMIDKMIAREPAHRYANCAEVIVDLESLGLDSPALSFIDEPARVSRRSGAGPATKAASGGATRPTVLMSSAEVAEQQRATEADAVTEQLWFVKSTNAQGRTSMAKLTTDQVRRAVKAGSLDLKAKASRTPKGDYLPLAQYPQFESAMHGRAVMAKAEARSKGLADIYQQIDKAEKRRRRWRWFHRLTEGALGWFGLVIWLAVVAAVGYGLYLGVPWVYNLIAEKVGLSS